MQRTLSPLVHLGGIAVLLAVGCATPPAPATEFPSAEQAVDSLIASLRTHDADKSRTILGPGADEVLFSGDEVADRNSIDAFLVSYDEGHHLVPAPGGGMTLLVGKSDWPMPIPLVEHEGRWSFDIEAGLDEMLSLRIGRNELDAVQVCLAVVDAQREFAATDPDGDGVQEYARKFLSSAGKRDGLFWPTKAGEPESPLGPLVAEAEARGYTSARDASGDPRPYRGYYFRMLESQGPAADGGAVDYVISGRMLGGFAVVAWPAEYANSGIKTFITNHAGAVFERDLGEGTDDTCRSLSTFDPGAGWSRVE